MRPRHLLEPAAASRLISSAVCRSATSCPRGLAVVSYNPRWPDEFVTLAVRPKATLGPVAVAVADIGSTSVPGLAVKDCIDIQVRVTTLDEDSIINLFDRIGFRVPPEPWNRTESMSGRTWITLVFAPPAGERASNVHVRGHASETPAQPTVP